MLQTKVHRIEYPTKNLAGAEGSKDLPFLKYYIGQEWESRFTLMRNTAKNIDYIEKCFKQKLCRIKFPAKN